MSDTPMRVLSLGAGVQSSTLYLMAVHGEFGEARPSVAIFADTQWEPADVYLWLTELERIGGAVIPIHRITNGNVRERALAAGSARGARQVSLPVYVAGPDGSAPLRRQCTREFKVDPLTRYVRRELLHIQPRRRTKGVLVERWMGISLDEATRMRDSGESWAVNCYPLIDRRMTRHDCERWLERHGYPTPPKSACIGCPYTSNQRWRELKDQRPDEWNDAVAFDRAIRHDLPGVKYPAYLHRSLKPLDQVDLSTAEDRGQVNMFENECEGMCGV